MKTLSEKGARIRVTPADDIWVSDGNETIYLNDHSPFIFEVVDWLADGHVFYGVFGPVVAGHARYHGLICSLLTRVDGDDWRIRSSTYANFKVGPAPAYRKHEFDYRHPDGAKIDGFPVIGRFGKAEIIE